MRWLSDNYKWLFDGVAGAAIIAAIIYLLQRKENKPSLMHDFGVQAPELKAIARTPELPQICYPRFHAQPGRSSMGGRKGTECCRIGRSFCCWNPRRMLGHRPVERSKRLNEHRKLRILEFLACLEVLRGRLVTGLGIGLRGPENTTGHNGYSQSTLPDREPPCVLPIS